jgi:hypothetical protein
MSHEIICDDALKWLSKQSMVSNVVTGICDLDEMPGAKDPEAMNRYLDFFEKVVDLIFQKLRNGCYAIFVQTDRKYQRSWIDNSSIITKIAQKHNIHSRRHPGEQKKIQERNAA